MTIAIPPVAPSGTAAGPFPPAPHGLPTVAQLISDGGEFPLSAADDVLWALQPGVAPFAGEFTVMRVRAEEWLAKTSGANWVTLEWDGRRFEKLRILKAVQIDPWHVLIRVADRRNRWRYVRYNGRHNLRRKINDRVRLIDEADEEGIGEDALRDDLRTVAKERYRQWTIKEDGSPRTAKEMLELVIPACLEELGEDPNDFVPGDVDDNAEIPDHLDYVGMPYVEIIASLCQRAELTLAVDQDGTIRFIDPYADPTLPSVRIKGGALRVIPYSMIRPGIIEVFALAHRERRFRFRTTIATALLPGAGREADNSAPGDDPPATGEIIDLQMVMPIPLPLTINGVTYQPGTYLEQSRVWSAIGVSETDIRRGWFFNGEGLRYKYARRLNKTTGEFYYDPEMLRWVDAIVKHYRVTFRIDPEYFDTLREVMATRLKFADTVTRVLVPSVAWAQWYDFFTTTPLIAKRGPVEKVGDQGDSFRGVDADGNRIALERDEYKSAPAELQLDAELGIVSINYYPAVSGTVMERIPSNVTGELNVFDAGVRRLLQFLTKNMRLSPTYRFETLLTVVEGLPNATDDEPLRGKGAHYMKRFRLASGGDVPKLQLFIRQDVARFDEDGKLVNAEQIDAIARAEAIAAAKTYRDRMIGVLTIEHDPEVEWKLTGHAKAIRFRRDTAGRDSVIFDSGEPPPVRSALRYMPQPVQQFVQRQMSKET